MRSKSIKKIIRKLSRKIICVNDSRYIKFKNFSILIGIFIFIILSTVSDVGAATVGKTIISAPTDPLRNGLVGWWTFDGNNMINNVTDSSGRGNNGYLVNMSTTSAVTAGNIGQALNFDGINDYVRVPPSSSLNDLGPLTYSAWVYLPVGAGSENDLVTKRRRIFALTNLQSPATLYFITSNDAINTSARSTTAISLKKWTHVAVVWNGQIGGGFSCDFYINGVVTGKVVFNTGSNNVLSDTSFDLTIGAFTGGTSGFVNGKIDDVRVYNRMLSASEMKLLYSYGVTKVASTVSSPAQTGLSSGLVGHWTFDGKNMVSNVADSSGSGNNGKMSGFTSTSSAVTAGKVGQGLRFDGSNDYVSANSSAMTYPLTLSAWVKLDAVPSVNNTDRIPVALAKTSGLEEFWIGFYRTSGGVNVLRSVAQSGADLRTYSANLTMDTKWHHVTAVFTNSSTHALYYDGVAQSGSYGTGGTGTPTPSGLDTLYISGLYYNTSNFYSPFLGTIDDVRVYNRTLSDTEIKQLYSQGSAKVASTISRPAQTGLSSGLVGHWTFDGKNMVSNVADSSGNGNNGMMSGFTSTSSAVTAGKVGQAIKFDGVNDFVSTPSITFGTVTSFSFWMKVPPSIGVGTTIRFGNVAICRVGANNAETMGCYADGTSGGAANTVAMRDGKWKHVVYVIDVGNTQRVYVNGVLNSPATETSTSASTAGTIGSGNATSYFNGSIDDVRVYNRVLSDAEIQQLYQIGK